ncbi:SDR family oxidoreductase [Photobacterium aphoticum]|uniref:Short-chain dehydrogenase n=1 Tax=Photobacterium aphoticum TaxID=754436 RepID=A0A0J1GLK5_9GAMM|nr:SDR family oxidoreductase [Photobacterium aphoticum]KLV00501.1 short-chain dehydrogenase [Photobacterium aphoticum]PSU59854.1 KR domain-containing protein [Photobacterium aphoticum]GHA41787.1 oxidoreductase [Photobacterium aphoticum]
MEANTKHVVLITGGANGIGKGIANTLSKTMTVVVADLNKDAGDLLVSENPLIRFKHVDVAIESEVEALIDDIIRQHGRLDSVINNAAIADPYNAPLETLDLSYWHKVIAVNLTAPLLVTKYSLPHLRKQQGAVINMSSTRALQSEPNTEAYSASKGGIVALTHSLAISLGPDVRVNCISPGWIDVINDPLRPIDHEQHPVGRVGMPDDITGLVKFLISEDARFITGQNFVVDGGMTKKMIYQE